MNNQISAKRFRKLASYDPTTGILKWIGLPNTSPFNGRSIGCPDREGYLQCKVDRKPYRVHRLAWLHYYGKFPNGQIDHINGKKSDNRIKNLRESTFASNHWNRRLSRQNKSGIKGVFWRRCNRYWVAAVYANNRSYRKEGFRSRESASVWARAKRLELHGEFANHG